ncbi:MAG: hypothetical protein AB7T63_15520 [Planctomycetota bacterium]
MSEAAIARVELTFACPAPGCGAPVVGALTPDTASMTCPACSTSTTLPEASEALAAEPFAPCPVCGSRDLFTQRDFNRRLGLLLAAIGLLLGPFTAWISTITAIAIDFALWFVVPEVVICYACRAQVRGLAKAWRPPAFEIAIHDVYKFDRRKPPRQERAVAGPLRLRLRHEGQE